MKNSFITSGTGFIVWRKEVRVKCTPAVTKAWTALLCFMVAKMKEGYHEACVEQTMKELNA